MDVRRKITERGTRVCCVRLRLTQAVAVINLHSFFLDDALSCQLVCSAVISYKTLAASDVQLHRGSALPNKYVVQYCI